MFDLGWQEFLLLALVAVIVVGPKDLPRVVRTISQWIRKARSMAGEFQSSLEDMAREADLDDVRKSVQSISKDGLSKTIEKTVDPDGDLKASVQEAQRSADPGAIESQLKDAQSSAKALFDKAESDRAAKKAEKTEPAPGSWELAETDEALAAAQVGAANKMSKIEPEADTPESVSKAPRKKSASKADNKPKTKAATKTAANAPTKAPTKQSPAKALTKTGAQSASRRPTKSDGAAKPLAAGKPPGKKASGTKASSGDVAPKAAEAKPARGRSVKQGAKAPVRRAPATAKTASVKAPSSAGAAKAASKAAGD